MQETYGTLPHDGANTAAGPSSSSPAAGALNYSERTVLTPP